MFLSTCVQRRSIVRRSTDTGPRHRPESEQTATLSTGLVLWRKVGNLFIDANFILFIRFAYSSKLNAAETKYIIDIVKNLQTGKWKGSYLSVVKFENLGPL